MVLFLPQPGFTGPGVEGERGVTPLTISPNVPLVKVLLPVPGILCSFGLQALAPKGGLLLPGDTTMIPLDWKTATWPLWAPYASESTGREGLSVLAGETDPVYRGELDHCPTTEQRKHMSAIWDTA